MFVKSPQTRGRSSAVLAPAVAVVGTVGIYAVGVSASDTDAVGAVAGGVGRDAATLGWCAAGALAYAFVTGMGTGIKLGAGAEDAEAIFAHIYLRVDGA